MRKEAVSILAAAFCFPAAGWSLGFRIPDQDPFATARGDAFAATADRPSAIYYNPAGITQIDGLTAMLGVYAINLGVTYDPIHGGDSVDTEDKILYVPQIYTTYKPAKGPFSFGLGVYSPFGLELSYPDDVPFRQVAKFGKVQFVAVNPVVAVEVTKTLSAAVGLTINNAQADLRNGILPAAMGGGDEFKFRGEGTSLGMNAGLLWKPTEQHSFGVSYHSGVTIDFHGHSSAHLSDEQRAAARAGNELVAAGRAELKAGKQQIRSLPVPASVKAGLLAQANAQFQAGLAASGVPPGGFPEDLGPEQDADAQIRFPQFIVFGYSFRPTPQWNIEFNADWTDWDVLNTVHLHQSASDTIDLPFNWRSSWMFELGVTREFAWQGMHASGGYVYSMNSIATENFNPIVPDSDRHIFSLGFGQNINNFSWDLAYQIAWGPTRTIQNGTLADGDYSFLSHAVTLSVGYHF